MRRAKGLVALLVLIGVTVGVPFLLLEVGANPLADGTLAPDALVELLTSPDDGTLLMLLLQVVAWVAWAFLALSILVELVAQLRGVRAPRLPGLRLPQGMARGLVAATLLLFTAVPAATSAGAVESVPAQVPQASATAITAVAETPGQSAGVGSLALDAAAAAEAPGQSSGAAPLSAELLRDARADTGQGSVQDASAHRTVEHTVEPGDSLWSLAERYLGDGTRFREIVELNSDKLADRPGFLTPGWVLAVPAPSGEPDSGAEEKGTSSVVVEAGDSLSAIAAEELGDAGRYPEIAAASRDIVQPGGARLTDPDVVRPGWTVRVPGAAPGGDAGQEAPQEASRPTAAPPTAAPGGGEAERAAAATPSAHEESLSDHVAWRVATGSGLGALLAAGVVTLLARRRRTQRRRRLPGQQVPLPTGDVAELERQVRAVADTASVRRLDAALRALAGRCADEGRAVPDLRAVRIDETSIELYLATPATLPAPWEAVDRTQTIWTLAAEAAGALASIDTAHVPAPYPSLVTLGHDDGEGHVLVNLEHLRVLGVTGDDAAAREVVASLVVELATSALADDLQVTVVGGFADLEGALRTGRVRQAATPGVVVDELRRRAAQDRRAMSQAGVAGVGAARTAGAAPDAWSPEIVVLATPVADEDRARLTELAAAVPRVAVATILPGATGGGQGWTLEVAPRGQEARLTPVEMGLRPRRLAARDYGHLLQLVDLTGTEPADDATHVREPSLAEVEAIVPIDDVGAVRSTVSGDGASTGARVEWQESPEDELDVDATHVATRPRPASPPRICVLGPVTIENAVGSVDGAERSRLIELAAYLALRPGASGPDIGAALWPERTTSGRAVALSVAAGRLRRWLGVSADGGDRLPRHQEDGRLALDPDVGVDVTAWAALVGDVESSPTQYLDRALDMVQGTPLAQRHPRRYAWAEPDRQRLSAQIVDVACEVARRRILEGRWRAAERAVEVGLRVEPAHEALWRLRVLAAHESRDPVHEAEAVNGLITATEALDEDLTPRTAQLLAALKNPGSEFDRLMADAL